jgi:hypothetical protein
MSATLTQRRRQRASNQQHESIGRAVILPPVDATYAAACASQCLPTKGFKNAPKADDDVPSADVEVIDPMHPLSGKRFRLISVEQGTYSDSCVRVEWRFGLTLRLPLHATNLGSGGERSVTRTKLSVEALEELVAVAEGSEGVCPQSLDTSGAISRPRSAARLSTTLPRS